MKPSACEEHDKVLTYFGNHHKRMDYPTYLRKGWQIGSLTPDSPRCRSSIWECRSHPTDFGRRREGNPLRTAARNRRASTIPNPGGQRMEPARNNLGQCIGFPLPDWTP